MNILGIDYGQKRIGLAWVQSGLDVVLPFGVIQKDGQVAQLDAMAQLINEEGIDVLVLGLPVSVTGEENENTARVRDFGQLLKEKTGKDVQFIDERFSSQQADRMSGGDATRDEKAAMVILQTFVDQQEHL